jgi:hypothetical protein
LEVSTLLLRVGELPETVVLGLPTEGDDLAEHVRMLCLDVLEVVESVKSFGCVFAKPEPNIDDFWDNPYASTWFAVGWGPCSDQCIANAARKLRATLRTGFDSFQLVEYDPDKFQEPVAARDQNGDFLWGDFADSGARKVVTDDVTLWCAIDGISGRPQSHAVAGAVGTRIAQLVRRAQQRGVLV